MTTVSIPAWNEMGLLPPIDPDLPTSPQRSPYSVTLLDVVMRFSTSTERRKVLCGFLDYRAGLHKIGFCKGFQWLDGSFLEDVEILERRPPKDIDVVSFLRAPENPIPPDADLSVLDHDAVKIRHLVDSYFVELDEIYSEEAVITSAYWYSVWSHRRNQAWKGFLQIDLMPTEDEQVRQWLGQFDATEVGS